MTYYIKVEENKEFYTYHECYNVPFPLSPYLPTYIHTYNTENRKQIVLPECPHARASSFPPPTCPRSYIQVSKRMRGKKRIIRRKMKKRE